MLVRSILQTYNRWKYWNLKRSEAPRAAVEFLSSKGETAGELANYFRRYGYKGRIGSHKECPCSTCLKDNLGIDDIEIGVFQCYLPPDVLDQKINVALTPQIKDFVYNFDRSTYLDLVKK